MELGALLKKARKRSGLTQDDLAERLHLTKSCISKFENNYKEPRINTYSEWFKHTNAQDLMIASLLAVDPVVAQQMFEMITHSVPMMLLGGVA